MTSTTWLVFYNVHLPKILRNTLLGIAVILIVRNYFLTGLVC